MAFKVEAHYNKWKISTGDGRPVVAEDLEAVTNALLHHYGREHDKEHCAFCEWVAKRRK